MVSEKHKKSVEDGSNQENTKVAGHAVPAAKQRFHGAPSVNRPRDPARPLRSRQAKAQVREKYVCDGISLTDQSQAQLTDVNVIMNRYLKGGQITHLRQQQGMYTDLSAVTDLHGAMEMVEYAKEAFALLPAKLRERLGNDPNNVVGFMSDPRNHDLLVEYGLIEPKSPGAGTPAAGKAPSAPPSAQESAPAEKK